jgi:hypothetical protein
VPNEHGWFFPSAIDPSRPVSAQTLYAFMWRQRQRDVIPFVTNRDLAAPGKRSLAKPAYRRKFVTAFKTT